MFSTLSQLVVNWIGDFDKVRFNVSLICLSKAAEAILAKLDEAFAYAAVQPEVADFCALKSFTLMPLTREESQTFLDSFTSKACYLLWDADACANNPADFGIER